MKELWVIKGYDDMIFFSLDDAVEYDMRVNPDEHSTDDISMERMLNAIHPIQWHMISENQTMYLPLDDIDIIH